jgi:CBS domain containing-hemolysin-like protein
MFLGGLFLTLAALPLILIGTALALQVGAIGENLRRRLTESGTGLDVGAVILLFRFGGGLLLIIGVLFVLFTWIALKPKRWARTGATVLAVVEILLLVIAMVVTTFDPVSLGIVLLAAAGVVLLRLPHSEEFLLTSR